MENGLERESLVITAVSPADAPQIQELLYKTWIATYPNQELGITKEDLEEFNKFRLTKEGVRRAEEHIRSLPEKGNELYLVGKFGQKVIGLARFLRHPDRNQLQTLYVLPEFQGKGVGTKFWEEGKKFFDPGKDIFVHVATYNANAIAFYTKLGFEETGKRFTNDQLTMRNGAKIPEMEMVLKARK